MKFERSEQRAICQYRLFSILLGENQVQNLKHAFQFEYFTEWLHPVDQLDANRDLIYIFVAGHHWEKVDELAEIMGREATALYRQRKNPPKAGGLSRKPEKPLIYYILYAHLLRSSVCDELGNYDQALYYVSLYEDTSWVIEPNEEEQQIMKQFQEWAEINTHLYRIMSGQADSLPYCIRCIEFQENEIRLILFKIIKAAGNRFGYGAEAIDPILERFSEHIAYTEHWSKIRKYSEQVIADRHLSLLYELAVYYVNSKRHTTGIEYIIRTLEFSVQIYSVRYGPQCATLFGKCENLASDEMRQQYGNLMDEVKRIHEEENNYNNGRL